MNPENTLNPQRSRAPLGLLAAGLLSLLSACSGPKAPPAPGATPTPPAPETRPAPGEGQGPGGLVIPQKAPPTLLPPRPVKDAASLRLQAAERLVAANPHLTYMSEVPEVLLAIPVLEVELYRDGTVKHIEVLRQPSQAKDTTQLAIDAVKRAAPFGDVSRMPKPWKFTETFLFNDERRFKPRTLDL